MGMFICMADLPILLLAGSILGAALNIIRGVSNDTTGKLNYKKVVGGVVQFTGIFFNF